MPCIGPIPGVILTVNARIGGLGVALLLTALLTNHFLAYRSGLAAGAGRSS